MRATTASCACSRPGADPARASLIDTMAGPGTTQPTPQRLAAIREQLSLLADYL